MFMGGDFADTNQPSGLDVLSEALAHQGGAEEPEVAPPAASGAAVQQPVQPSAHPEGGPDAQDPVPAACTIQ